MQKRNAWKLIILLKVEGLTLSSYICIILVQDIKTLTQNIFSNICMFTLISANVGTSHTAKCIYEYANISLLNDASDFSRFNMDSKTNLWKSKVNNDASSKQTKNIWIMNKSRWKNYQNMCNSGTVTFEQHIQRLLW